MTSWDWFSGLAPEGKFMCCLCFEAHPFDRASVDADGQRWDVCIGCAEVERAEVERVALARKRSESS